MFKRILIMLTTVCMILGLLPAVAGAASNNTVVVQLTVGSPTVTINGATSAIQKPYVANGTTLVPLSVITKAFGAGLALNKKVITLTYNNKKVVLTIGSKTVVVDGKATTVAVAPTIVNNVTMVPLRVITTAFGATISTTGKQIVIVGVKAGASDSAAGGSTTGGINIDSGKTKVGDSYYGWSMSYPSDLTLSYQSDSGDFVVWSDVNENAQISVSVEDVGETYTKEEIRDYMLDYSYSDDLLVEKKTVTVAGQPVEKIVTKSRDGWYYENRAIQKDTTIYLISAGVKSASREALNEMVPTLDSFTAAFNSSDKSLKDITKVKDGQITAVDKDYGLSVKLPVGWYRDDESSYPVFWSEDYYMDFTVSSAKSGETAADWMKRERTLFENNYLPSYRRNIEESTIQIDNGEASLMTLEYSVNSKDWYKSYDVYYVEGKHKYVASFMLPVEKASEGDGIIQKIISTISIATDYVDDNFSEIEEEDLTGQTIKKTSKKYGYSVVLPQSWDGYRKDFEGDTIRYDMDGYYGTFGIDVLKDKSVSVFQQETLANLNKMLVNADEEETQISGQQTVSINGVTANKFVIQVANPTYGRPYATTYYAIEKNGYTYVISYSLNMANDTAFNREPAENAVQSFIFNS